MRIVVNHLTRMQPGYICVAGVDPETRRHVRPVLDSRRLSAGLLVRQGGPFDIGALVDLGATQPAGRPPECEDYRFNQWKAARVRDAPAEKFWRMLESVAQDRLAALFGPDLQPRERTYTLEPGHGAASLGCLRVDRPAVEIDSFGKVRIAFAEGGRALSLPVTDIRLYAPDGQAPLPAVVADLSRRIAAGVPVILSVGLSRAYVKFGAAASCHWLQVNNIHLADAPLWLDRER